MFTVTKNVHDFGECTRISKNKTTVLKKMLIIPKKINDFKINHKFIDFWKWKKKCKNENIRPPFLGIPFWYSGNDTYSDSCDGCGWFDGTRWREEVTKILIDKR